MKINIKSISFKVSLLYLFLAILNISFFSIIIYENQIDLITENTKYQIKELTSTIISSLNKLSSEMGDGKIFKISTREEAINEIRKFIGKKVNEFTIFTEEGDEIYKSNTNSILNKKDVVNGIKAVTNIDFTGKQYYSVIDENSYEISFYIPFKLVLLENSILFLKFKMDAIGKRLSNLYQLIILLITVIAFFHIIFAVILFRLFVKPIKSLHEKSVEIRKGNLSARAFIKQRDEIGDLGNAFNNMADSIQEKITTLQRQNEIIEFELDIAGNVQQMIFPKLISNDHFTCSIFHRAFGKVSGDYYDILPLGDSRFGFLIVDVSGHGVPAALITMIVQDMFKRYAPQYNTPSELFQRINSEITAILSQNESPTTIYFSSFYLIVDKNNQLSYCNAGHLRSVLLRKLKKKLVSLNSNGFLIGVSEEMNHMFESKMTSIESGDKIILYTDGITEAKNSEDEEFGMDRMLSSIQKNYLLSAENLINAIITDLSSFTDIDKLKDDATIFIIDIN